MIAIMVISLLQKFSPLNSNETKFHAWLERMAKLEPGPLKQ